MMDGAWGLKDALPDFLMHRRVCVFAQALFFIA
jgi:hypothetical protein